MVYDEFTETMYDQYNDNHYGEGQYQIMVRHPDGSLREVSYIEIDRVTGCFVLHTSL